ncbi:MAG: polysaccharide deacetylase family protein [Calditrichia bacterium]|nr:polysaccharide deacetylase family protein [Calditrichia bacterium]
MFVTLSFDIEEYFQVENLRNAIPKEEWQNYNSSVEKNTRRILNVLEKFGVKGTFFILGMIAEKLPGLVLELLERGHEVASHGYGHDMTARLNDKELEEDIRKSKTILESIIEKPVLGYRAPNFTVDDRVISVLKKHNFLYDSSFNPFQLHGRYGSITAPLNKKRFGIMQAENGLYEIPISTLSLPKVEFPIGGGAYFRIFPFYVFNNLVKKKIKKEGFYNFYLHPWELEPEQPRVNGLSFNHRFRHYYGLNRTERKLEKFIKFLQKQNCEFVTMEEMVEKIKIVDI